MEAGECGLTCGTCFIICHLEVIAVSGLLWLSWYVFGQAGFFLVFRATTFFFNFVHERTTDGCERPRQQLALTK